MSPQKPKTSDEAGNQFHMMVGFCITEWARVDDHLFNIFHQCVGPLTQCAIIYYRVPGLDMRVGLVDEIVHSVLPAPDRKSGGHKHPLATRWGDLQSNIRNLLGTRRRIAHHPVTIQRELLRSVGEAALSEPPEEVKESFAIYASENERLRVKEADKSPLTATDLFDHLLDVNRLLPEMYRFYLDLVGELYAKPSPQDHQLSPATSKDHAKDAPKSPTRRRRSSRA